MTDFQHDFSDLERKNKLPSYNTRLKASKEREKSGAVSFESSISAKPLTYESLKPPVSLHKSEIVLSPQVSPTSSPKTLSSLKQRTRILVGPSSRLLEATVGTSSRTLETKVTTRKPLFLSPKSKIYKLQCSNCSCDITHEDIPGKDNLCLACYIEIERAKDDEEEEIQDTKTATINLDTVAPTVTNYRDLRKTRRIKRYDETSNVEQSLVEPKKSSESWEFLRSLKQLEK